MIELIILLLVMVFIQWYFLDLKTINGYVFARFPIAHKNSYGSLPNPKDIKRGYKWTNVYDLKFKFKRNDENTVYINNFKLDDDFVEKSRIPNFMKKRAENTAIYFKKINLTQGLLLVGKMSAGKTEFYTSILNQKFYNRAVIHQVKAGDFVKVFYRKNIDILFSPYDRRGYIWDVLSEDEGIIKTFFENYTNAVMGDKKDFFSATAQRLYNELAQKINTIYKDETPANKWLLFIKSIKDMFIEMDSGSQNSKKDVKGTMEAMIEPLEIMAYKMQNPKQKFFVINDFFEKKNQCKLILDNIPKYEKSLIPLFAAFTACLSQVQVSRLDTKTDLTIYALDEYLSFIEVIDDASKKRLHTLIRSKGGIMMPAVQYIPKDNKKLQQMLTSSAYAWIYFSGIDDESINHLKNTVGEVEYSYKEENVSYSKGERNRSYSTKNAKDFVIYNELLNGLGEKYEHIVYLPNHKMLYKGYTPQSNLRIIAKESILTNDIQEFSKLKYINENTVKEDLKNLTFADLFKEKPMSKLEEFKLFNKFKQAKQKGEDELKSFKKNNNLVEVNLEFLFKRFMEDKQVIATKMKLLTVDDRFRLKTKWDKLQTEEEQLEFIEKNELFGALPSLFDIHNAKDDDIESLEDNW